MRSIWEYLVNMLPYMAIALPPYFLCRILFLKTKKQPKNRKREVLLCLFVMLMAGILSQTVIPKIEICADGWVIQSTGKHINNFIPLRVFPQLANQIFVHKNFSGFLINFLGNILLFVPIGFLIKVLWKLKDRAVILIGFSISFGIEFTQLFLPRNTDVDDLILNTAGVALGVLLYKLVQRFRFKQTN